MVTGQSPVTTQAGKRHFASFQLDPWLVDEIKEPRPPARAGETIDHMKNRDANRHPGIMRVMRVDSEFAGILVAVGFLVMGAVGLDIGRWFVLGAVGLGVAVALLLRFTRKSD